MICGVDEAGRGPVMGPMVIAAVMIESDLPLRELKVKDSKQLTRQKRDDLAPKIREIARVEVIIVSADEIDAQREKETLNALEARLFANLIERMNPDTAVLDAADVLEGRFKQMVESNMRCRPEIVCEHKADVHHPIVSAASIMAKTARDDLMDQIGKEIGEPIGSGYASDPTTIAFLNRYFNEKGDLPPHTRRSWATAKEIYSLSKLTKLTDWTDK